MQTDERGHATDLRDQYKHHPVTTEMALAMNDIREAADHLHTVIEANVPQCRARSLAFTGLEEVLMWANKGVILGEKSNLR